MTSCAKSFQISVAAAPLVQICSYGGAQPLLIPHATANPSAAPEWDGTMNVSQVGCYAEALPTYRYQGLVSIQGKEVRTQTDCVGPDLTAPWIVIYPVGGSYRFEVLVAGGLQFLVWSGDLAGVNPVGTYISNGAGSDPRPTLDICAL